MFGKLLAKYKRVDVGLDADADGWWLGAVSLLFHVSFTQSGVKLLAGSDFINQSRSKQSDPECVCAR